MSNVEAGVHPGDISDPLGTQSGKAKNKSKGLNRLYSLFRPSSADARRQDDSKPHNRMKVINGLTQVNAPDKERFIPIASHILEKHLQGESIWAEGEEEFGRTIVHDLAAWRHQSYRNRLSDLKKAYLTFSPDTDTVDAETYTPLQRRKMRHDFMELVGNLLESANFEKITQEDLDLLLASDSPYGLALHVDLDAFDDVVIYFRGAGSKIVEYRDWKWLYLRKKYVETPIFQRLFVALKLKPEEEQINELMLREELPRKKAAKRIAKNLKLLPDGVTSDHIYLKLFKNIPQDDLEMLFPNTKVTFKLLDKLKLGLTAGGGTVAGLFGIVPKLFAAATLLNPITLLTTLAGFIGLIVRQITKFFNQRNEYMMTLAQNLYFHNLANNRGVLTLLVDRAEEEDTKEELLLYSFLVRNKNEGANISLRAAKEQIEEHLRREFNVDIEFDHEDAFSRLLRDGLVKRTGQGRYEVLPPAKAVVHIRKLWQGALKTTENQPAPQVIDLNTAESDKSLRLEIA